MASRSASVRYERETVERVAVSTHWLRNESSARARLVGASQFTRECALALSARGWGLRRQLRGLSIDGVSIDSLVNLASGDVAVVVLNAGESGQAPTFIVSPANVAYLWVNPHNPNASPRLETPAGVDLEIINRRLSSLAEFIVEHTPTERPSHAG